MTESRPDEVPPLHESLANTMWDSTFWEALSKVEEDAKWALIELGDKSYEDEACACETCVVRTVLESVWPVMTMQFQRLLELSIPPSTLHCSRTCKGRA